MDLETLKLKQRAIQAELSTMEMQFRLLPYLFKEKQEEMNMVQGEINNLLLNADSSVNKED